MLTRSMKALDEVAYKEFFHRYYHRLWSYLNVVSKGDERFVEDALQTTFTRIVKNIREFDTEKSLWRWISTIARNAYFDCCRKENTFQRMIRKFRIDPIDRQSENETTETELHYLDTARSKLSSDEQALIQYKYIERQTHKEIAQITNSTAKAVESKLARVRQKLRNHVEEERSNEE